MGDCDCDVLVPNSVRSQGSIPSVIRSAAAKQGVQAANVDALLLYIRRGLGYDIDQAHFFIFWHVRFVGIAKRARTELQLHSREACEEWCSSSAGSWQRVKRMQSRRHVSRSTSPPKRSSAPRGRRLQPFSSLSYMTEVETGFNTLKGEPVALYPLAIPH